MSTLLIDNIGELVTNDPALGEGPLGIIRNAAVVIDDERFAWVGHAAAAPDADRRLDVHGCGALPGFVDSHTHLVFAGDRANEFAARMAGQPYEAGGIRVTMEATRAASDAELRAHTVSLRAEGRRAGITTVEIKSGYGLRTADEVRCLRIGREHTHDTTFLGAHVVPPEFAGCADDYVAYVIDEMLPAVSPHARWCDVFCETGAFDADQSRAVLLAGRAHGLEPRIHANQLGHGPGVQLAVELGAASADHCTYLTDGDLDALGAGTTVATFLPAADFSTRSPYPDARRAINAGVTIALATNCNPGSSFTTSMGFVIALAVRDLRMTADEAIGAATLGGAKALRRTDVGVVTPGARADLVVLRAPSYTHFVYRPGVPLIATVIEGGIVYEV